MTTMFVTLDSIWEPYTHTREQQERRGKGRGGLQMCNGFALQCLSLQCSVLMISVLLFSFNYSTWYYGLMIDALNQPSSISTTIIITISDGNFGPIHSRQWTQFLRIAMERSPSTVGCTGRHENLTRHWKNQSRSIQSESGYKLLPPINGHFWWWIQGRAGTRSDYWYRTGRVYAKGRKVMLYCAINNKQTNTVIMSHSSLDDGWIDGRHEEFCSQEKLL